MLSVSAVRVGWGAALALFPDVLLRPLSRTPPSPADRVAARVLGVRHVLQGAATARGFLPPAWGAVPDALHAASMAGLALYGERRRGAALVDFCVACAFTMSSVRDARAGRVGDADG